MAFKVAIIGSGISGLGAAHALSGYADITLLEAGSYFGGHTNTVDVTLPDVQGRSITHGVDTGFLVFNERTYPNLLNLFAELGGYDRNFLTYIDDLGFADNDSIGPRHLRSWLEGGVEARPANVRLAVTSNRRAIVPRNMGEQDDPINPRDVVDDKLALADRFGLSIGFHACDQDSYLAIIAGYCESMALEWDQGEALEWARRRGARSGRTAWQFVTEVAGRAGRTL